MTVALLLTELDLVTKVPVFHEKMESLEVLVSSFS